MYQHDNSWFNSCISLDNLRFYFIFILCCALLVVLLGFFGILLSSELFIMAFYTLSSVLRLQRWWSWSSTWRASSGAYRLFVANFALCLVATFLTWVSHGRAVSSVHAKGVSVCCVMWVHCHQCASPCLHVLDFCFRVPGWQCHQENLNFTF